MTFQGRIGAAVSSLIMGLVQGLALFVPAGRLDWPMAWAVLVFYVIFAITGTFVLSPELLMERTRRQPDASVGDLLLAGTAFVLIYLVSLVVAGQDFRHGWTPPIPGSVQWLGFAVFAAGYCFSLWAVWSNPFFSTVVRVQRERGHHVVATGPYAFVRHPGYAGPILGHVALPIALGSAWALVPALAGGACLALRAVYEERTLANELPGYRAYMQRVRWRLYPYVW